MMKKLLSYFLERSEQAIRELDIKYGKVCHNLSYNIVEQQTGRGGMCQRRLFRRMERHSPGTPEPVAIVIIVKIVRNISLKIYWRKEAAKRSSHYTIALEEIEACIADPNTVEA